MVIGDEYEVDRIMHNKRIQSVRCVKYVQKTTSPSLDTRLTGQLFQMK